ncbi:VOC family protein [bacterium]|nr:VOC family protein [bacterium]MBU1984739.1 VOC family protein [bacterium]
MPRVIHFEIPADDPERAAEFYRKVFDWKIEKWAGPMDYWMCRTGPEGEPGINGAIMHRMSPKTGDSPAAYICTIGVPGFDDYARRVAEAGGSLTMPKQVVPGVGWFAYCTDSEGNLFGIIEENASAK